MRALLLAAAALLASPAGAAVVSSSDVGFEQSSTVIVAADAARAWAMLTAPARWWDGAHSWSGSAANLSLDARVGGCFCETMPDGGRIEHARVIAVLPNRLLRLTGALGPMQEHGITGVLSFTLKPAPGGTAITMGYAAAGYFPSGMKALAPVVDAVNSGQLARLAAALAPKR